MTFPPDTISATVEISNIGSSTIYTTGGTVLYIRMQQSGTQSESRVICDGVIIGKNYSKDYEGLYNKHCNTLIADKTGNGDKTFYNIAYIPRQATSTTLSTEFNYGDITIATFLLLGIAIYISVSVINLSRVFTIKKKYE